MRIPADWPECVVYVCKQQSAGGEDRRQLAATGFVVATLRQTPSAPAYHYVVTAKHVIDAFRVDDKISIRFNFRNGVFEFVETTKENWILHNTTDVAVMMLAPLASAGKDLHYRTLPCPQAFVQQNLSFSANFGMDATPTGTPIRDPTLVEQIQSGDELCFIGMCSRHAGDSENLPIARFGNLSWLPSGPVKLQLPREDGKAFEYE